MKSRYFILQNVLKRMASSAKKLKLSSSTAGSETKVNLDEFMNQIQKKREETAESILNYKFNKKRVRIISQEQMVPDKCEGIVYWMSRDSRVQDNWAFLFAQKLALKNEVPLHVCFCIIAKYLDASVRQFHFLLKGNGLYILTMFESTTLFKVFSKFYNKLKFILIVFYFYL